MAPEAKTTRIQPAKTRKAATEENMQKDLPLSETGLSFDQIKELMTHMKKEGVTNFQMGEGKTSISIAREKEVVYMAPHEHFAGVPAAASEAVHPAPPAQEEKEEQAQGYAVTSPVVGVFYDAPSPEDEPYVTLGSFVKKGDVLCIIEAMKLMNEVTSPVSGQVKEILVKKASRVEFGQKLYIIDPGMTEDETNE